MADQKPEPAFLLSLSESLEKQEFVKLSLGHYKGGDEGLKQIHVRLILVKREQLLSFTYRYKTRDIVKNYPPAQALAQIEEMLGRDFLSATLFTTAGDLVYDGQKGRLQHQPASHKEVPALAHDRAKVRQIASSGGWLQALGLTDAHGKVLKNAQDKFRQIDKYVEILAAQLKGLDLKDGLRVADMGAGKGYLTFALYDYLTSKVGVAPQITGVEYRRDLVELCNKIAGTQNFSGLHFVQGTIEGFDASGINVLIALHACDTATDDAIAKGVKAGADLIVVAPCCHKQIRNEMEKGKAENELGFLLRHGTFLERQAEMVTDGLRAMMLEYEGYSTKVFEFISDAHTPKNVMIVATRNPKAKRHDQDILKRINETKAYFGIKTHHLEKNLEIQA